MFLLLRENQPIKFDYFQLFSVSFSVRDKPNKDKPSVFYTLQKKLLKSFLSLFWEVYEEAFEFPRVTLHEKSNLFCEIPFLVQNSLPCLSNSDDLAIQVWSIGEVMRRGFNEHHMMQVPITENQLGCDVCKWSSKCLSSSK